MNQDTELVSSNHFEGSSAKSSNSEELKGNETDDPYSLSGTSDLLLGLVIALASIVLPVLLVFTQRPFLQEKEITPNSLGPNGSKFTPALSFSRFGKPSS